MLFLYNKIRIANEMTANYQWNLVKTDTSMGHASVHNEWFTE